MYITPSFCWSIVNSLVIIISNELRLREKKKKKKKKKRDKQPNNKVSKWLGMRGSCSYDGVSDRPVGHDLGRASPNLDLVDLGFVFIDTVSYRWIHSDTPQFLPNLGSRGITPSISCPLSRERVSESKHFLFLACNHNFTTISCGCYPLLIFLEEVCLRHHSEGENIKKLCSFPWNQGWGFFWV